MGGSAKIHGGELTGWWSMTGTVAEVGEELANDDRSSIWFLVGHFLILGTGIPVKY